jgi:4-amino-4-deoxy-L-arabinose transferase-like glycosyltransferase
LAVTSLLQDSITFDETSHLTAGFSYLHTGDFRLAPEHPPLAKMWAALPLLLTNQQWPAMDSEEWHRGLFWTVGRDWLFHRNDGERLIVPARCMMVVLLLATCLAVYWSARIVFGMEAGLLALTLAVLDPSFLAHGRLVTTDMASTLCVLLCLLTFARLMTGITWRRLLAAAAAFASLTLVKFSWPIVLPALAVLALIAVLRPTPMSVWLPTLGRETTVQLSRRWPRVGVLAVVVFLIAAVTVTAIWCCYAWRYSPFRGPDRDSACVFVRLTSPHKRTIASMDDAWEIVLEDEQGRPSRDVPLVLARWARDHRLLPEAYLIGMAATGKSVQRRLSYMDGQISEAGFLAYFPLAFAIKTPIATMILLVAGVAAVVRKPDRFLHAGGLLAGMTVFAAIYLAISIVSRMNIGHRHLLPIYPAVMVLSGAAVFWRASHWGRWGILAALGFLALSNAFVYPHYLSYFNELIGGPKNGHYYLADSNIDWGQDMKRLGHYARSHRGERIKLAYFGSGIPQRYGFECEKLPSFRDFPAASASLTAGTYILSATQMVGAITPQTSDTFWQDGEVVVRYRALRAMLSKPGPAKESAERSEAQKDYDIFRQYRLMNRLGHRRPDERIGYSLFVFRLTNKEVEELTQP